MQSYPPYFMAHNLYDKYTAVGCCGGMNLINGICGNINRALEAKSHIRSPQVIVNRLRKGYDMQPFFSQHIRRLVCTISSKHNQAVQVQLVICMLHSFHLVQTILIRHPHQLKRLSGGSKDCSSYSQYS